jgi:hypothetical protein
LALDGPSQADAVNHADSLLIAAKKDAEPLIARDIIEAIMKANKHINRIA